MKNFFLTTTLDAIFDKKEDITHHHLLIYPSKRAALLSKKILQTKVTTPTILPLFLSIEELIEELCKHNPIDTSKQLLVLYTLMNKKNNDLTLIDFLLFGQIVLNDFNLIHEHVATDNYDKLFTLIDEFQKIQVWAKEGENLTKLEFEYIHNWNGMKELFLSFTKSLAAQNEPTKGMLLDMSNDFIEIFFNKNQINQVAIIGFNAINLKENRIFNTIAKHANTEFYFDADHYYTSNKLHEAGYFISNSLREFAPSTQLYNDYKAPKKIQVIQSSGTAYQCKIVADLLKEANLDIDNTLIVLNDEELTPVLCSYLFSQFDTQVVNFTMGYKVCYTSVYKFIFGLIKVYTSSKEYEYKVSDFLQLASFNEFNLFFEVEKFQNFKTFALKNKIQKVTQFNLNEYATNTNFALIHSLFFNKLNLDESIVILLQIIKIITNQSVELLEKEASKLISNAIEHQLRLYKSVDIDSAITTFFELVEPQLNKLQISLEGNSNKGLQVMGMLETRNLDFENVILLSMNEGVLPAAKNLQTFIPFDVIRAYQIPDYTYSQSIFSYHFYRLLQRCTNVYMIYNVLPINMASTEPSRFISQLEYELLSYNESVVWKNTSYFSPIVSTLTNHIVIEKDEIILNQIKSKFLNKYISASQANVFLQCQLRYYWQYVLGIQEPKNSSNALSSSEFGTIVHDVLFEIFKDLINIDIDVSTIMNELNTIENRLTVAFNKEYKHEVGIKGELLINWEKAKFFISNALHNEIKKIEVAATNNFSYKILYLEQEFLVPFSFNNTTYTIGGKFDRVELWDDTILICDYKTSSYSEDKITSNDFDELHSIKKNMVNQLLFYILVSQNNPDFENKTVASGIYFLGEKKKSLVKLQNANKESINSNTEKMNLYENYLKSSFEDFLNPDIPITQTTLKDNCKYCHFNSICKRQVKSSF